MAMMTSDLPKFDVRPRRMRRNFGPLRTMMYRALDDLRQGDVRCIQVGAHDGRMADPLFQELNKGRWSAMLIEPHPIYFSQLQSRHSGNEKVNCVNVGISDRAQTMKLYHIDEEIGAGYPRGLRGCASLERDRLEAAIASAIQRHDLVRKPGDVTTTDVNLVRLDTLMAQNGMDSVDIIVIDVEGHELAVLDSFALSEIGASMLIVECNAANLAQEDEYVAVLEKAGFEVFRMSADLYALHPERMKLPFSAMMNWIGLQPLTAT